MKEQALEVKPVEKLEPKFICTHCDRAFSSHGDLVIHQKNLVELNPDEAVIRLRFQPYIDNPPQSKEDLWAQACSGDSRTVNSWAKQWLEQMEINGKRYDFKKNSVEQEFGKFAYKPVIIAGSGPSLKRNAKFLVPNKTEVEFDRGEIGLVSCLHNYGFFEDQGIKPEYYVTLDAGQICVPEMYQGGSRKTADGKIDEKFYWDSTKDKTLIAVTTTYPELLEKWQGKILFFTILVPDQGFMEQANKISDFKTIFSTGGNTLGACLYFSKAFLGANPVAFIGADFSFSYKDKFHPFDSPYDTMNRGMIYVPDIYGNTVGAWPSYYNFKAWFDFVAMGSKNNIPASWVNCSEGGILGAYPGGNIRAIKQMQLHDFIQEFNAHRKFKKMFEVKDRYNIYL